MIWCRPLLPFTATKPRSRWCKSLLRPIQLRPPKVGEAVAPKDQVLEDEQGALLCRTCRARITSEDLAMTMNGQHQHAFFNPAGIAFEIRCFWAAPGALAQGVPSSEFSWFAAMDFGLGEDGFWQMALCATCHTHLGWRFVDQPGSNAFFGLITSRLLAS